VVVRVQDGKLLFNAEPGMLIFGTFHNIQAVPSVICVGRLLVVLVGLTQHNLVVTQPERITVKSYRVKVDVSVASFSLVR